MTKSVVIEDLETADLAERIDATRITYPDEDGRPAIEGTTFSLEFDDPVDPESFCEEISTPEDPWRMFGIKLKLADERTDETGDVVASEYWSVAGVLIHVEDGTHADTSKIDLEITSEWVRVYVKEGCCEHRAAEFVRTVDQEFGVTATFADETGDCR
ncbi:hypothetical protein [Natronorubrum sp. FCH18a]|uniref:hypothetical protein n=1 Tax=Natronorubrum sp. FCH18a TaxID=3447018 RepID=UPI003F5159F1